MKNTIVQFIKFGLVGGLNTVLSLLIYYFCLYLGLHYYLANAIAWFITVNISYVLNNILTFKGEDGSVNWSLKALFKVYASYSITGIFLNTFLLWLWVQKFGISEAIAPIINLMITIPTNFILNKFWAYKK